MKYSMSDNVRTGLILSALLVFSRLVTAAPWWSYVIPAFGLGMYAAFRKWKTACLRVGFLTGFLVWVCADAWFQHSLHGGLFRLAGRAGGMAVFFASGIIGGLLSGLALYSGKSLLADKKSTLTI
ncbi:MAG: hypothetical protein JST68_25995 [Bacteroidetes bacterium]|nr:hypothetical protein [Bacteroidota bacterium]